MNEVLWEARGAPVDVHLQIPISGGIYYVKAVAYVSLEKRFPYISAGLRKLKVIRHEGGIIIEGRVPRGGFIFVEWASNFRIYQRFYRVNDDITELEWPSVEDIDRAREEILEKTGWPPSEYQPICIMWIYLRNEIAIK